METISGILYKGYRELYTDDGDGQSYHSVYHRRFKNEHHYLLVVTSDDGEVLSVVKFFNGQVEEL